MLDATVSIHKLLLLKNSKKIKKLYSFLFFKKKWHSRIINTHLEIYPMHNTFDTKYYNINF